MNSLEKSMLMQQALSGKLSRRQILNRGLALGLSTPLIASLMTNAPSTSAATASRTKGVSSSAQSVDSGTLTIGYTSNPVDLDPHSAYSTVSSLICLNTYEMLVRYKDDSTDEVEPMLAESFEWAEDQSAVTFTLPADVLFQDGSVCDAQAVKDSMIRFRRLERGPFLVLQRFIDNPEDQIEVLDAVTVRFNFDRPQPLFLAAMASSYGPFIVSPTAVAENATDDDPWAFEFFQFNPVGTGPYRLTESSFNDRFVLERDDDFHGGWDGNHFSRVIIRIIPENATRRQLIEQGEVDVLTQNLTPEDVDALREFPDVTVMTYPSTRVDWSIFNAPRLLTPETRQGLSYAFPYDAVVDGVYRGLLQRSGPIPSTVAGHDPDVFLYQTDLEKARELLTAGGFQEGDSFDLLISSEFEEDRAMAQLFQASLAEIGFTLQIDLVDLGTLTDIVYGDSPAEEKPMLMGGWAWWPDYNDPHNQLAPNFLEISTGGGGSNGGYWVNDRFEEIMAEAEQFEDFERLQELMVEAQNILTELDPPAIYLGETIYYTILRNDIRGFMPNPLYLGTYFAYDMSRES